MYSLKVRCVTISAKTIEKTNDSRMAIRHGCLSRISVDELWLLETFRNEL